MEESRVTEPTGTSSEPGGPRPLLPSPPQVSPDGRWWWDGQTWQPMPSVVPTPPTVFCRTCGKALPAHAAVCLGCGAGQQPVAQGAPWIANTGPEPKSSGVAVLLTILIPGAGHLYIGNTNKGTPYLVANVIGLFMAFTIILFPFAFLIWIITLCMTVGGITRETEQYNVARCGRPA